MDIPTPPTIPTKPISSEPVLIPTPPKEKRDVPVPIPFARSQKGGSFGNFVTFFLILIAFKFISGVFGWFDPDYCSNVPCSRQGHSEPAYKPEFRQPKTESARDIIPIEIDANTVSTKVNSYNEPVLSWPPSESERFLDFKHNGDHVEIPDSPNLDFRIDDEITISAWVNPRALNSYNEVVVKDRTTGGKGVTNYALRVGNGTEFPQRLTFYYLDKNQDWQAYQTNTDVIPLNTWSNIAVSYKFGLGDSIKLYVNGVSVTGTWTYGDGNSEPGRLNGAPLWIGSLYDSGSYNHWTFNGLIGGVQIYRKILTNKEIQDKFSSTQFP